MQPLNPPREPRLFVRRPSALVPVPEKETLSMPGVFSSPISSVAPAPELAEEPERWDGLS
jgi:hypothetical protein